MRMKVMKWGKVVRMGMKINEMKMGTRMEMEMKTDKYMTRKGSCCRTQSTLLST